MNEHHSLFTYLDHFGETWLVLHIKNDKYTHGFLLNVHMNHHITFDSDTGAYTVKQSTLDE